MKNLDQLKRDERPFSPLPTDNEQLILLALAAHGCFADVLDVSELIETLTNQSVNLAYRSIHRLLLLHLAEKTISMIEETKEVFGEGRPKYTYSLTDQGKEILQSCAEQYRERATLIESILTRGENNILE